MLTQDQSFNSSLEDTLEQIHETLQHSSIENSSRESYNLGHGADSGGEQMFETEQTVLYVPQ